MLAELYPTGTQFESRLGNSADTEVFGGFCHLRDGVFKYTSTALFLTPLKFISVILSYN